MATTRRFDVKDVALAPEGLSRIEWADRQMPVLAAIRDRFEQEQPLSGYRISACLHVTSETANLMRTLKEGGADVVLCASNPLSTQDDVAAALVEHYDISVFAIKGEDNDTYYQHIEAAVDHKPQLTMDDGADVIGDIFVTATGDKAVITSEHMLRMKDGAVHANTGHFNVEIEIPALRSLAVETRTMRPFVDEFRLEDGRRLYLIADGRLVNLSAAEGHPAQVMDMSFANQAFSAEWVVANAASLERRVYPVPEEIDQEIARRKLETMGVAIDELTEEQAQARASE